MGRGGVKWGKKRQKKQDSDEESSSWISQMMQKYEREQYQEN